MWVVFDSNIRISALEFGGTPRTAVELADEDDDVLFCRQIGKEVERILTTRFKRSPEKAHSRVAELTKGATVIVVTGFLLAYAATLKTILFWSAQFSATRTQSSPATRTCSRWCSTKASACCRRVSIWTSRAPSSDSANGVEISCKTDECHVN